MIFFVVTMSYELVNVYKCELIFFTMFTDRSNVLNGLKPILESIERSQVNHESDGSSYKATLVKTINSDTKLSFLRNLQGLILLNKQILNKVNLSPNVKKKYLSDAAVYGELLGKLGDSVEAKLRGNILSIESELEIANLVKLNSSKTSLYYRNASKKCERLYEYLNSIPESEIENKNRINFLIKRTLKSKIKLEERIINLHMESGFNLNIGLDQERLGDYRIMYGDLNLSKGDVSGAKKSYGLAVENFAFALENMGDNPDTYFVEKKIDSLVRKIEEL